MQDTVDNETRKMTSSPRIPEVVSICSSSRISGSASTNGSDLLEPLLATNGTSAKVFNSHDGANTKEEGQSDAKIPSTLTIPNYNEEMRRIETHFYRVGYMSIGTYASLLLICNAIVKTGKFEVLTPTSFERSCLLLAFVALVLMITLQYIPLFVNRPQGGSDNQYSKMSGVVFLGLVVASTAAVSNGLMAFSDSPPIMVDPFTGARVHMYRWCEWTCLAFCMTFLVEGCDVPDQQ